MLAWTALWCVEKGQYSWRSIKHLEFLYPQILRETAPAERTLPIHLFQFLVRWNFLVSVQSQFDQRLHMQVGIVDVRWAGSRAAGSGRAVCYWRKAARLPSALTCASVSVHLESPLTINCPRLGPSLRKAWQWLFRHCSGCVLLTTMPCISRPSPNQSLRAQAKQNQTKNRPEPAQKPLMNVFTEAWGLVLPVYIDHFKLTTQWVNENIPCI